MNTQVLITLTDNEYRALQYLNASAFKEFVRSPHHYKNQQHREETEEMRIGTAVHALALEPKTFNDLFAFAPAGIDKRTTVGKQAWADFEVKSADKILLKSDSLEIVTGCVDAMRSSPTASKLIDSSRHELVVIAEIGGVQCKGKLDIVDSENGIIADIKTTKNSADGKAFKFELTDRKYWVQVAFYTLLAEAAYGKPFEFKFIVCEKDAPFGVAVHTIHPNIIKHCQSALLLHMAKYTHCKEHNAWVNLEDTTIDSICIPCLR